MTVKEACKVLSSAKGLYLVWDSQAIDFDAANTFMMDAFGKYVVESIDCREGEKYELYIAAFPFKAD